MSIIEWKEILKFQWYYFRNREYEFVLADIRVETKIFVFVFSQKIYFHFRENLITKIYENNEIFRENKKRTAFINMPMILVILGSLHAKVITPYQPSLSAPNSARPKLGTRIIDAIKRCDEAFNDLLFQFLCQH